MNRIDELKRNLRLLAPHGIALAFSGGVDSTFLLSVLKELHDETPFPLLALTMHTVFQSDDETEAAKRQTAEFGVEAEVFTCDPLALPEVRSNPPDRCYWCKRKIFRTFLDVCRARRIAHLLDGTNADDGHAYRPGRRALKELGVLSPLGSLGFTKQEIRELSAERGLPTATKPSMPCLATRFEYGAELTPERIAQVGRGEAFLRTLLPETADLRLRVQGKNARIEVPAAAFELMLKNRAAIAETLHGLGFEFVTLDLEGYRSGCYDKNLTTEV